MVDPYPGSIYPGETYPASATEAGTEFQVHPSSPPLAWSATGGTVQTGSFTPPGGALLVVAAGARQSTSSTAVFTPSSTGVTGLTWTTVRTRDNAENGVADSAAVGLFVAALPGTTSAMTVSMAITGVLDSRWVTVYVVTGADIGAAAVGASAEGGLSTADPLTESLTATATGSLLFVAASDWNAEGIPTSGDLTVQGFDNGAALSAAAGYRTMSSPPTATTWTLTSPGAAAPAWTWSAMEIKEAPTGTAATNSINVVNRARYRAATW
jgi:hypothetical protein